MVLAVLSLVAIFVLNFYRIRHAGESDRGRARERRRDWPRVRSGTPTANEEDVGLMSVKVERPGVVNPRRATFEAVDGPRGRRLSVSGNECDSLDEREGEGFMMVNGRGAENEYVNVNMPYQARFLPAPSHHRDPHSFSWTFTVGNKRRRVSVPSLGGSLLGCGCVRKKAGYASGKRHGMQNGEGKVENKSFVRGLLSDVKSVAWPPVGVLMVIAWWMFR